MYLSNNSLEVEVISSKSSEMNILVPKSNGDYVSIVIGIEYAKLIVKAICLMFVSLLNVNTVKLIL